jgi:hypothetical protein
LLALVAYGNDGEQIVRDGGTPLGQLLTLYLVAGLTSGVMLGLLRPFATSPVAKGLVSVLVALPVTLSLMLLGHEWRISEMGVGDYALAVLFAAVFGPVGAAYIHLRNKPQK